MAVPDSPANQAEFIKHRGNNGGAGYPSLRLLVLVSCGTRTVLDAVFGPTTNGETSYAPRLVRSLREGMIVLLDRNFAVQALAEAITRTGAHVLVRVKENRRLPVLERFPDGSCLSRMGAVVVRVIDCAITVSTSQGRRTGAYHLVTTLTDPRTHPAAELIRLYHERWDTGCGRHQHGCRPRRHHRPPGPGRPHTRPAHPHPTTRRQTRHLEIQRQRHRRPNQLQGHDQPRHPHRHPLTPHTRRSLHGIGANPQAVAFAARPGGSAASMPRAPPADASGGGAGGRHRPSAGLSRGSWCPRPASPTVARRRCPPRGRAGPPSTGA
ncbi:transposase [Streptomyces sp. NPDC004069]